MPALFILKIFKFFRYVEDKYRDDRRGIEIDSRNKKREGGEGGKYADRRRNDRRRDRDRHRRDREHHPSFRDIDTPKFKLPNTPSSSLWEEEDFPNQKPSSKKSSWDFDTPREGRKEGSERNPGSIWRSERDRKEREQRGYYRNANNLIYYSF